MLGSREISLLRYLPVAVRQPLPYPTSFSSCAGTPRSDKLPLMLSSELLMTVDLSGKYCPSCKKLLCVKDFTSLLCKVFANKPTLQNGIFS